MKIKYIVQVFLVAFILVSCAPAAISTPSETTVSALTVASTADTPTVMPALPTPTITPTPDKPVGTNKQSAADAMMQLYIPAGDFSMGTKTDNVWFGEDEFPQHAVLLNSFWMDKTEVTNAQYQQCIQAGMCTPPHGTASETRNNYFDDPEFAEYPVIQVDWEQADTYCKWAERRLPTEAEWEKAARGKMERTYPWQGEGYGPDFANSDYFHNWPNADTTRVGSIPGGASPYKVMDMAGNVYEWTADWYAVNYYSQSPADNPAGPDQGTARVIRGGAWTSDRMFLRTASRMPYYPEGFSNDIGFRCAQSE